MLSQGNKSFFDVLGGALQADSFPGRVKHAVGKAKDDLTVAGREGAKDIKKGASAAKHEAEGWFK